MGEGFGPPPSPRHSLPAHGRLPSLQLGCTPSAKPKGWGAEDSGLWMLPVLSSSRRKMRRSSGEMEAGGFCPGAPAPEADKYGCEPGAWPPAAHSPLQVSAAS